ncbi:MAG: Hsp20/alpha crystallin family protein [Saprospiraceae bacterium]|nr:Hsp20/alpha crystallin family protein [Saprospiraceae bacterium]
MYHNQAFGPTCMHSHRRKHHHHHPFKKFMHQMKTMADTPPANVEELDDRYVLSIYAPGFKREDFEIKLKDDTLLIQGKTTQEELENNQRWRRKEFGPQSFERYFQLNEKIDKSAISAKYEDGILSVVLLKMEGFESVSQQIEVH